MDTKDDGSGKGRSRPHEVTAGSAIGDTTPDGSKAPTTAEGPRWSRLEQLLPQEVRTKIPRLYQTSDVDLAQKVATVKVFDPVGRGTWYLFELDPETDVAFAYVVSPLGPDCDEAGYVDMAELAEVRNRLGLHMERDLYWKPGPVPELQTGGSDGPADLTDFSPGAGDVFPEWQPPGGPLGVEAPTEEPEDASGKDEEV